MAEPRPQTRQMFANKHGVPAENVFASHTELLAASDALIKQGKPRIAMAVIICVQDRIHDRVCPVQLSCALRKAPGSGRTGVYLGC